MSSDPAPRDPSVGPSTSEERRLFVYDTMLAGEAEHGLLRGAALVGSAKTEAAYHLVDLGAHGALVPGGTAAVAGELYAVDRPTRAALDVHRQVPILFARCGIRLGDGSVVDAYVLTADQVRGRRRIASADWRTRFAPPGSSFDRPWTQWAKGRRA
jgi:gamma-glutamylcyclotransferase (GGCT)/AIG2-like uncharacterized protein YtfP